MAATCGRVVTTQRLTPANGALYAVRWVRRDGRDVKHRYFRRRPDAERFRAKITAAGRDARTYRTATSWQEEAP